MAPQRSKLENQDRTTPSERGGIAADMPRQPRHVLQISAVVLVAAVVVTLSSGFLQRIITTPQNAQIAKATLLPPPAMPDMSRDLAAMLEGPNEHLPLRQAAKTTSASNTEERMHIELGRSSLTPSWTEDNDGDWSAVFHPEDAVFSPAWRDEGWKTEGYASVRLAMAVVPLPIGLANPSKVRAPASAGPVDAGLAKDPADTPVRIAPVDGKTLARRTLHETEMSPSAPESGLPLDRRAVLGNFGLFAVPLRASERFAAERHIRVAGVGPDPAASGRTLTASALAAMALPDPALAAADEAALGLTDAQVDEIRLRLKLAGVGADANATGLGGENRSAIARMQRAAGLPVTGYLDAPTVTAIDATGNALTTQRRAEARAVRIARRTAPTESPQPPKNPQPKVLAEPVGPVRGADGCLRTPSGRLLPGQGLSCDVRGFVQALGDTADATPERLQRIRAIAEEAGTDR
ncbi:MAG: peptidoglycan-binding domain-containing protein [Pseudomonadota bacterium]